MHIYTITNRKIGHQNSIIKGMEAKRVDRARQARKRWFSILPTSSGDSIPKLSLRFSDAKQYKSSAPKQHDRDQA